MKSKLYLYTFAAVAVVIFTLGFFGKDIALQYMQDKYINLQLDVNKRQAETIAKFLEQRLEDGISKDSVKYMLQNSISDMNTQKGFVCMFDTAGAGLVCHPDKDKVGMQLPDKMQFDKNAGGDIHKTVDVIKSGVASGGLFHTEKNTDIAFVTPVKGTDWMLASHENIDAIKTEIKNQRKIFFWGFIVLSIITAILATAMARLIGRRYERTIENKNTELADKNEELKQQKEEILTQSEEIRRQKDSIEEQNKHIFSSIRYAGRIQTALLPHSSYIGETFKEHFVFYKPRDIVSGDFYWFKRTGNKAVFVAADSTGHGVPGAMMSMLGIAFLNEIISDDELLAENYTAASVLNKLRYRIKNSLKSKTEDADIVKDGMDLALVIIDIETNELRFAGAYNPLILIRNDELKEIKADKMPVGTHSRENTAFTEQTIKLEKDDNLYMFSDGFIDQFGGPKNRKYLKKRFKKFLKKNSQLSAEFQKAALEKEFDIWRGKEEQLDDVLVTGIKI